MEVKLTVRGCDDATDVTLVLTEEELSGIRKLARASHLEGKYGCQPEVFIIGEDNSGHLTTECSRYECPGSKRRGDPSPKMG